MGYFGGCFVFVVWGFFVCSGLIVVYCCLFGCVVLVFVITLCDLHAFVVD